jgi:hypothetical protein
MVHAIAFGDRGPLIAVAQAKASISLMDFKIRCVSRTLPMNRTATKALAVSPVHRLLASGTDDNVLQLWDAEVGELLRIMLPFRRSDRRALAGRRGSDQQPRRHGGAHLPHPRELGGADPDAEPCRIPGGGRPPIAQAERDSAGPMSPGPQAAGDVQAGE